MEEYKVRTEDDFNKLMEFTDAVLQSKGVLIHTRPFQATSEISRRFGFGESLKLIVRDRQPAAGIYTGDDLTIRIYRWFRERYGDRLRVNPSKKIAILIRQDIYQLRIPYFVGTIEVICDPERFGTTHGSHISRGGKPITLNVLDLVEGLTEGYARSLTYDELLDLGNKFKFSFETTKAIYGARRVNLVPEAIGNLEASISLLFTKPPQYGLSKWESLQLTEKFIKAFISVTGTKFPFNHELDDLAALAESVGLPVISRAHLAKIQCPAGVRYGTPPVTLKEAVEAHHAALAVSGFVAANL